MDGFGLADILHFEGFRLDRRAGCLCRVDQAGIATQIALGSRTLDLLALLVSRAGQLVAKDEILAAVWPGRVVEEANLNVQISKLRHILDHNRPQAAAFKRLSATATVLPARWFPLHLPLRPRIACLPTEPTLWGRLENQARRV